MIDLREQQRTPARTLRIPPTVPSCDRSQLGRLCFFSSRRRHTRLQGDWSSDVCSSDLCRVRNCQARRPGHLLHRPDFIDRKSTRLNSSHLVISYAVFCLKKKTEHLCSLRHCLRTLVTTSTGHHIRQH